MYGTLVSSLVTPRPMSVIPDSVLHAVLIQQLANLHLCLSMHVAIASETELVRYQSESAQQRKERLRRQRAEC